MRIILCIAHDRDVDGLGCHAIMHRFSNQKNLRIIHIFTDYDRFCKDISGVSVNGVNIVIADLGYNKRFKQCESVLKKLISKNRVVWYDHHDWSEADLSGITLILKKGLCASEILQQEYLPTDEVAAEIANLARAHDFRMENKLAWKLYDVISSGYDKLKLVKLLAKGVYWNNELEEVYNSYSELKEKGFKYLEKHSKLYNIKDFRCIIGLSDTKLSSTLATEHLLKKNVDLVICIWKNGKMSFRRRNQNINLRKIASIFDGGGREEAAGGFFYKKIDETNYLEIFDEIIEIIKKNI